MPPGCGSDSPVANNAAKRKSKPKGTPKKKRTCVAPAVPIVAVSCRWVALRNVCAAAAISVKTIQSQLASSITPPAAPP